MYLTQGEWKQLSHSDDVTLASIRDRRVLILENVSDMKGNVRGRQPRTVKPGPAPATLQGSGNWEDAAKKALEKKRPPEVWPKPETKKRAAKK